MNANLVTEVKTHLDKKYPINSLPKVVCADDSFKILIDLFDEETIDLFESFKVLYLNSGNRVIGCGHVSSGGVTGCIVDVRIVLQKALLCNASGIILSHNHPSQNINPSEQDKRVTKKIKEACKIMELSLLDHLIVTSENGYYSFAENGLI